MQFVYEPALKQYMLEKNKKNIIVEPVEINNSDFDVTELHVYFINDKQAESFKIKKKYKGYQTDLGEVETVSENQKKRVCIVIGKHIYRYRRKLLSRHRKKQFFYALSKVNTQTRSEISILFIMNKYLLDLLFICIKKIVETVKMDIKGFCR